MLRLNSMHKFIQRLRKMRPIAVFTTAVTILLAFLLLLPLILLFILVGFIGMTLLSRQYMKPHRSASSSPFLSSHSQNNKYHNLHHELLNHEQEKIITSRQNSRIINL